MQKKHTKALSFSLSPKNHKITKNKLSNTNHTTPLGCLIHLKVNERDRNKKNKTNKLMHGHLFGDILDPRAQAVKYETVLVKLIIVKPTGRVKAGTHTKRNQMNS